MAGFGNHRVQRYVKPFEGGSPGAGMPLDEDGLSRLRNPNEAHFWGLLGPKEIPHDLSFVVLGEPGLGKTRLLEDLAPPGASTTVWVHLGGIVEANFGRVAQQVRARVLDQRIVVGDEVSLTLVLDGVDECEIKPRVLAQYMSDLLTELSDDERLKLRVLMGCRAADWPMALSSLLAVRLPGFAAYVVAPLSSTDVGALARSAGVDSDAFLTAVRAAGVGPLAAVPLTLAFLLNRWERTAGLTADRVALYGDAMRHLAEEWDGKRSRSPLSDALPGRLVDIASRLCAYAVLSGKPVLTESNGLREPGELDSYAVAELAQTAGNPSAITRNMIHDALATPIFSSRGPGRYGAAHPTFAAYLAAKHLCETQPVDPQLLSLLTVLARDGRMVIPVNLRETASWVVAMRGDQNWLRGVDLRGFAGHGVSLDPDLRSAVVDQLLTDDDAFVDMWSLPDHLQHPGLTEQLHTVLQRLVEAAGPKPTPRVAILALRMAAQYPAAELLPTLLAIASSGTHRNLRSYAVTAAAVTVGDDGDPQPLKDLLRSLTQARHEDPDGDLRGQLLTSLWPAHLTTDELFAELTLDPYPTPLNNYRMLCITLPAQLVDDDLPAALAWALTLPGLPGHEFPASSYDPFGRDTTRIIGELLDRALSSTAPQRLMPAAARLVLAHAETVYNDRLPYPRSLWPGPGEASSTNPLTSALRRGLAEQIIELASDWGDNEGQLASAAIFHWDFFHQGPPGVFFPRLLDEGDFGWLLDKAVLADDRRKYTRTLHGLIGASPTGVETSGALERATECIDAGWPEFKNLLHCVVEPDDPSNILAGIARRNWQQQVRRERAERDAAEAAEAAIPVHAATVARLYAQLEDDPTAFAALWSALQRDPDNPTETDEFGYAASIAAAPSVRLLPAGWLGPVGRAAARFLEQEQPPPEQLDLGETYFTRTVQGYQALAFLSEYAPAELDLLSPAAWRSWSPSLLLGPFRAFDASSAATRAHLLTCLASKVPDGLATAVARVVDGHHRAYTRPRQVQYLGPVLQVSAVRRTLLDRVVSAAGAYAGGVSTVLMDEVAGAERELAASKLEASRAEVTLILPSLLAAGDEEARQWAHQVVGQAGDVGDAATLLATQVLVCMWNDATQDVPAVLEALRASDGLRRTALPLLALDFQQQRRPGLLADAQVAELWSLLQVGADDREPAPRKESGGPTPTSGRKSGATHSSTNSRAVGRLVPSKH